MTPHRPRRTSPLRLSCLSLALALLLSGGVLPIRAQEPDPAAATDGPSAAAARDTAEVLAAAERFLTAFDRLEWEPFHDAFSPSATAFLPFGAPARRNGREEVAAFFRTFFDRVRAAGEGPRYLELEPGDLRVDALGEGAVVTFHLPGEREVGRRTLVFDRDGPEGPWRIAHLHASSLERTEPEEDEGAEGDAPSELLELNREILRRMIEEQDAGLLRNVALDEFHVVAPGGRVESLDQAEAGVASFSADATIEVGDEQVLRHGATAVVIGKLVIDGEMEPVGPLPPLKFTTVFVRDAGRWRLLARALTPCFEVAIQHGFC
jgi:ketosteroid isomerase-like protein